MSPQTFGLIANTAKAGAKDLVDKIRQELARAGRPVTMEAQTAALVGEVSKHTIAELGHATDLLIVLGGDGTILQAVGSLQEIKPVFGINIGSLGFLTCASSSDYREAVEALVSGQIAFSERVLLSVEIQGKDKKRSPMLALNDVVLSRGEVSRLIRLRAKVNDEPLTEFNADGLVIATPTGSTAYSLSAGGPILAPQSGVFVITPICPHVLTNRSIIVEDRSTIAVEPSEPDYPVYLTIDGREPIQLEFGCTVVIRRAEKMLPLAVLPQVSFFSVVRQKLKWSGSTI